MSEKFKLEHFEPEDKVEPEDKETGQRVQLKIVQPHGDKNFMIGFKGETEKECEAYNWAIRKVLERANLDCYHQVGDSPSGPNEPGYHAWEVWKKVKREDLEALLPEIEQEAESYLKSFEE